MPWSRSTRSEAELIRKIGTLSTKLLEVNATLRLKTIYCERLEVLLHQRNQRVDTRCGEELVQSAPDVLLSFRRRKSTRIGNPTHSFADWISPVGAARTASS